MVSTTTALGPDINDGAFVVITGVMGDPVKTPIHISDCIDVEHVSG